MEGSFFPSIQRNNGLISKLTYGFEAGCLWQSPHLFGILNRPKTKVKLRILSGIAYIQNKLSLEVD
jgi:hypothetical protein